MKTKIKTKYKNLILAFGLTFCVGAVTMAVDQNNKYEQTQAVMYYTDSECKLTAEECNNITFNMTQEYLESINTTEKQNTTIKYNNNLYTYEEDDGDTIYYNIRESQTNEYIGIHTEVSLTDIKIIRYSYTNDSYEEFEHDVYFYNAKWFVNYLKESTLKLTASQLNNDNFNYLAEKINQAEETDLNKTKVMYENELFEYDEFAVNDYINWNKEEEYIRFYTNEDQANRYGKFKRINSNYETIMFEESITIYNAQYIIQNINAPFDSGNITENIASGLGLIGNLATTFLTGFAGLFWNSTANTLTVFGIFSLVFLGIAITFAVVKLCLNLIRSNTGV